MKIIDKIVVSPTPPTQIQNAAWFDGKEIKIPSKGKFESTGGSGGGIEIVDSVDKLDPNAELGSMASVVTPGSIQETNLSSLPQPDASIIDQTTMVLNASNCPLVSGLSVIVPTSTIPVTTNISENEMIYFGSESMDLFGGTFGTMLGILPVVQNGELNALMAMYMDVATMTQQNFTLFSITNGVVTADQDAINQVNTLINGLHYIGSVMYVMQGQTLPAEVLAVYDMVVKVVSGIPSITNIYVKGDEWGQLYKKDLDKLYTTVDKHTTTIAALDSKIPTKVSQLENDSNYINKKNYIETPLISFRDASRNDWTGLHIQDNTTYFITTPIDDNATIYLNDTTSSMNSNIDIILFSKGYRVKIIVGNASSNGVESASKEIDYDIGFFKISISYSTFLYDNGYHNKGMTASISRTKIPGHVYIGSTSETTFTDNYLNRKPRVFLDGVLLKHGDIIPEKENAVFLTYGSITCYAGKYFGISSLKELYVSSTSLQQYGNISWVTNIGTLKLANICKSIDNHILRYADNVYIYSISDWLQHIKISEKQLFKESANLYIKNSLWTGVIPSDVKYISNKYIIDRVNIERITFEGIAPYMQGFAHIYSNAKSIHAKSVSHLHMDYINNGIFYVPTGNSWFKNPSTGNAQRSLHTIYDRWIQGELVICYLSRVANFLGLVQESITIKNCCVIDKYCFNDSSLRIVHIENVDLISGGAFMGCEDLEVVTCNNILEIDPNGLFSNCTSLQRIDFSSSTLIPILSDGTLNTPSTCKIIVPDALYDEWIAATNWSTYASYIIKKSDWDASQTTE